MVEEAIERLAREYSRAARVPGFRPGKVPPRIVRQRFKEQILHDVAHELIPRAIDEALRERSIEPVDTPDVRDVVVEEGQPLTFTAPSRPFRPSTGDCKGIRFTGPVESRRRGGEPGARESAESIARYERSRIAQSNRATPCLTGAEAIKDGEPADGSPRETCRWR